MFRECSLNVSVSIKKAYLVWRQKKYVERNCLKCVDLKIVNFLLGQQGGYTKYPCYICLWDSQAKTEHWTKKV